MTASAAAVQSQKSRSERLFWPLAALMAASVVAGHLPSLRQPHFEGDEVVLTFMAERVRSQPLHYSLRGPLLGDAARRFVADAWLPLAVFQAQQAGAPPEALADIRRAYGRLQQAEVLYKPFVTPREYAYDPEVYDRPMFFHPPAYVAALAAFRAGFGPPGGPLLSILSHAAGVVLLGVMARRMFGALSGLLAAGLLAVEPVAWMAGQRVWIDGCLQTACISAVLAAHAALRATGVRAAWLAGLVLGAACLTKFPAVLLAAPIAALGLMNSPRPRWGAVAAYALGVLMLLAPWLILTRVHYGAWLPAAYPSAWLIENYPYVRMLVNRPPHFYLTGLLATAPVLLFAALGVGRALTREPSVARSVVVVLVWALAFLVTLTFMGAAGQGFQLRYLAPATPALCLLVAAGAAPLLSRRIHPAVRWPCVALLLSLAGVGAVHGVWSAAQPPAAEPFPITLLWLSDALGVDFWKLTPGMWRLVG